MRVALGLDEGVMRADEIGHRRGDGVEFGLHAHRGSLRRGGTRRVGAIQ